MHVPMTSMTSSVERTDLDFKISVALVSGFCPNISDFFSAQPSIIYFCSTFHKVSLVKQCARQNLANNIKGQ